MLKNMEIEQLSVALGHHLQYLEDGKGMEYYKEYVNKLMLRVL